MGKYHHMVTEYSLAEVSVQLTFWLVLVSVDSGVVPPDNVPWIIALREVFRGDISVG